jgi:hypothetical protein
MSKYASETISREDFDDVLLRYSKHVKSDLAELDVYRFETFPTLIADRQKDHDKVEKDAPLLLLSKDELVELVTWKVKHGTFRPKLKALVESNDEDTVHKIIYDLSTNTGTPSEKLKLLTQLKGIGPATASLVLSCIWPMEIPFFSDELFRWLHWDGKNADGTNAGIKTGKGWARSIGYTPKEYQSLIARCQRLQERLSDDKSKLRFLDIEKVAYVLGKEKIDIDSTETEDFQLGDAEIETPRLDNSESKKGGKRKSATAESEKPSRRSKRTKK